MTEQTSRYDSQELQVQVGKAAGATSASRWYDFGEPLVQLAQVAGATLTKRPHICLVPMRTHAHLQPTNRSSK